LFELTEKTVECPYSGEAIDVLLDPNESDQSYIEDCQVCCRPIVFNVIDSGDGDLQVLVKADNE
jgi:hypothetical protein